jgi:hypothetical protein
MMDCEREAGGPGVSRMSVVVAKSELMYTMLRAQIRKCEKGTKRN